MNGDLISHAILVDSCFLKRAHRANHIPELILMVEISLIELLGASRPVPHTVPLITSLLMVAYLGPNHRGLSYNVYLLRGSMQELLQPADRGILLPHHSIQLPSISLVATGETGMFDSWKMLIVKRKV